MWFFDEDGLDDTDGSTTWIWDESNERYVRKAVGRLTPVCTCGGHKLRHPSHSDWCDSQPNAPAPHDNSKGRLF